MSRLLAALSLALPLTVAAAPPDAPAAAPAEGRIVSDEGYTEILGRRVRVGETIVLPEGFIRVEEEGTEDGEIGSFTVVPAATFAEGAAAEAAPPPPSTPPEADAPRGPAPPADGGRCRAERSRYLAELWRMSGIEFSSPAALMEGLESGEGADAGFYWFALATDPFRPLAWSSELRARAETLARCVRGE